MKTCQHCGTTYPDTDPQCPNCDSSDTVEAPKRDEENLFEAQSEPIWRRMGKPLLGGGLLVLILLMIFKMGVMPNHANVDVEDRHSQTETVEVGQEEVSISYNTALSAAQEYAQSQNYKAALKMLNLIPTEQRGEKVNSLLQDYEKQFVDQAIESAKEEYIEFDFDSLCRAEAILDESLQIVQHNKRLNDELKKYQQNEPIKLSSLQEEKHLGSFELENAATDNQGHEHQDVFTAASFEGAFFSRYAKSEYTKHPIPSKQHDNTWTIASQRYKLDFQFRKLTGCFFQMERYKLVSRESGLAVYNSINDNKDENFDHHEYEWAATVSGSEAPVNFSIDTSDAKYISIVLFADPELADSEDKFNYVGYGDMYLWK